MFSSPGPSTATALGFTPGEEFFLHLIEQPLHVPVVRFRRRTIALSDLFDQAGRIWSLSVNVGAIKRVRSLLSVDLMQVVEGKLLKQLINDPVLLSDIIYVVCKTEADAQSVSDEDFGKAMAGDAIEYATTALLEELAEFFPLEKRRLLQKALNKLKTLETKALEMANLRLDSPELEAEMKAALNAVGNSSGKLPESSELTPDR